MGEGEQVDDSEPIVSTPFGSNILDFRPVVIDAHRDQMLVLCVAVGTDTDKKTKSKHRF